MSVLHVPLTTLKRKLLSIYNLKMASNAEILRGKGYTYLYHITRPENYEKMKDDERPSLHTPAERHRKKIAAEGVLSIEKIDFETPYYKILSGGFPGIYLSLTRMSLEELREKNAGKGCRIIFPLELMNQKNWHLNLQDRNGYFYPDTIPSDEVYSVPRAEALAEAHGIENEVVFHDQIPLSNLVDVVGAPVSWRPEFKLDLDLETLPCYIYYSGRSYSGYKYPFIRALLEHRAGLLEEEPPVEDTVTVAFFREWLQKYLPVDWTSDFDFFKDTLTLQDLDQYLAMTIHPDSGMNLVNHFFYHRFYPEY